MTTLLYLKLSANEENSETIIPSLEYAIRKEGLAHHFIFSSEDNNDKKTSEYYIYFEVEPLLEGNDSSSFFELHVDQGNKVNFHAYGGIKTRFPVDDTDTEIKKLVEKMKEYI